MLVQQAFIVLAILIRTTDETRYNTSATKFRPHSFETFQEEEYLEKAFRTPRSPVQIEQKSFYSGINAQSSSKSITTIPAIPALLAIPALPAIPVSEVE